MLNSEGGSNTAPALAQLASLSKFLRTPPNNPPHAWYNCSIARRASVDFDAPLLALPVPLQQSFYPKGGRRSPLPSSAPLTRRRRLRAVFPVLQHRLHHLKRNSCLALLPLSPARCFVFRSTHREQLPTLQDPIFPIFRLTSSLYHLRVTEAFAVYILPITFVIHAGRGSCGSRRPSAETSPNLPT